MKSFNEWCKLNKKNESFNRHEFDMWMQQVNKTLIKLVGVDAEHYDEYPYQDWFAAGENPIRIGKKIAAIVAGGKDSLKNYQQGKNYL